MIDRPQMILCNTLAYSDTKGPGNKTEPRPETPLRVQGDRLYSLAQRSAIGFSQAPPQACFEELLK